MTAKRGGDGGRVPARARRPRGSLSREAVVAAALALVDEEGVGALSMPRLARRLDAGVMTLYGYVRSKQELLDAVAMRAIAEVRVGALDGGDWRAILLGWGRGMREVLLAHPGVAGILAGRSVIGAGIFRGLETLLGPLGREGFAAAEAARAVYAVLIYTLGFVIWETPRSRAQPEEDYAAQWREGFARLPAEQFPGVAAALPMLGTLASAEQFEFGLRALVAGLRPSASAPPAPDDGPPRST
ncbi:MAG TPA: TetR/AcrR family transcriptional regulator C-terminal domain-containing protein [Thermomicrobiales bacterium]|nr:TetR/AcrR family transcriptional regulator C-terminal domain-containing protein [Thermomicrobiales bacterium]